MEMPGRLLVTVVDLEGGIRLINEHCERAIGCTSAQANGQRAWELLTPPDHAETMRLGLLRAMAGDAGDQVGFWQAQDGVRFGVHWSYSTLRAGGEAKYLVITGQDSRTTSALRAELFEVIDRHQAILDTAVDGIITIDVSGQVQSFNRAAERIFGYRAAEVVGRNVSMLMPQPYRSQHDGYLHSYLTTHRKQIIGIGREVSGLRKDGTVFPLELSVGEVSSSNHRFFTGIIRDSTDRNQLEAEARRRQEEMAHMSRIHSISDLAAGLAHEITQPLTAILSTSSACLRMMDASLADAGILRESLAQIARQAERAADVIRHLRRHIRQGEAETELYDVGVCINDAMELLRHDIKAHGVHVDQRIDDHLPKVLLDRVQIEQVLINLVRNAIQAWQPIRDEGPKLEIAISRISSPDAVQVSIDDNGPGFGSTDPETPFAPFFTTKQNGLGQGLSICRRIIQSHGGEIRAENRAAGGARFWFWLPLPQESAGEMAATP
jgi:two-component system sensor kinase FixL